LHSGFQRVPLPDGEFTFSIGNPPFGSESLRFSKPELYVQSQRRTPEDEQRIRDLLRASEAPGKSKDAETTRRAARQQLRETAPWIETGEVSDPLGGAPMPVNQYFADHPEMVGRLERSGTMHVPDELAEIARSGYPEKADDDPRRAAGRPIHQRHHCLPRPHLLISGQMTRYAVTQRRCPHVTMSHIPLHRHSSVGK
jgi:hypothetical protein